MVDILNKFDILTEKLIKVGKSHNLLRIPMFIAVMALVVAEGIYEISKKVYRFLFKKRFLSKALSFAVAWFMFAPFYQPAVIFAMEEVSVSEPSPSEPSEESGSDESSDGDSSSSETPSASEGTESESPSDETTPSDTEIPEETTPSEPSSDETTPSDTENPEETSSSDTDNTDTTPADPDSPDQTEVPEEDPALTEESSVTPSETELPVEIPELFADPVTGSVEIESYNELYEFLRGDYGNVNITLVADIDANDGDGDGQYNDDDGDSLYSKTLPAMAAYNGTFEGNGHVIKNVKFGEIAYGDKHVSSGVEVFTGMFKTFDGEMTNVGFYNVTARTTAAPGRAAVVAFESTTGKVYNCYIAKSDIYATKKGTFIFSGGQTTNCHVNGNKTLDTLNENAELNGWLPWYPDTSPVNSNGGYPSMKPTTRVEFYKSGSTKFADNELSFSSGDGEANADNYAVVAGNQILYPDAPPSPIGWKFSGWATSPDVEIPSTEDGIIADDKILVYVTYDENKAVSEVIKGPYTVTASDIANGTIKLYAIWDFTPTYKLSFLDNDSTEDPLLITDKINAGEKLGGTDYPASNDVPDGYKSIGWFRVDTDELWILSESTMEKSEYEFDPDLPDDQDPPAKIIELKEKFEPIEYSITLNRDGGEFAEGTDIPDTYNIETPTFTIPNPTKNGYTFVGWKNGSDDPDDEYEVVLGSTGDISLTAIWEAITYDVEYDTNGGSWKEIDFPTDAFKSYTIEDELTLPDENTITRKYYTFEGWELTFENSDSAVSGIVDAIPAGSYGKVTATAVWKAIEYTITYENTAHGGIPEIDGNPMPYATTIVNENQTKYTVESRDIVLSEEISCNGYAFKGWTYNGSSVADNTISLPADPMPEGITISGEWEPIPYTVTYNTNGGYWDAGFNLINFSSYDITKSLTLPTGDNIYRNYYTFNGWKISGDCNKSGTTVSVLPEGTYGNAVATAEWNPIPYTITLNLNGGRLPDGVNIPSTYSNATLITLPIPSKTGYTFDGWKAVVDSGYADNGNFPTGYVTKIENNFGNVTLTAYFTINKYTISFDTDGGSEIDDITQDYDTVVTKPDDPTKEGYNFIGWYEDEECTIPYSFVGARIPAEDITLYAKWEIKKFNVSFETNGGSSVDPQIVEYGNTATRPQNPAKNSDANGNYRFLGWFSDSGLTETFDFSTPIKENTTVYAKWLTYEDVPPVLYNVSYKTSADSTATSLIGEYAEGEQVVLPNLNNDDVNHKVFAGFILEGDTAENPTVYNAGDVFTVGTEDVTFIVVWETEKYSVTFDSDGGDEIEPQIVEYNQKATEPSCQKRGYIFKGWFTEDGTKFSFNTPITEDIVLIAKWETITIPETPSRPGSSDVKYNKTIRITETPDGITAPAELFKVSSDMDNFSSSIDVRITNASESAEEELKRLLALHADVPDEDIFVFDVSIYERGTSRKATLPQDTMISLTIPVCDKFTSQLEKVRVISVHNGKLVIYPNPYISSSGKHLLVNFSSDKFSTFAFVLDRDEQIMDLSASAPSAVAAEMMLYTPPAMMPAISGVIVNGKTKLRISRKKKIYKVLRKFH